MFTGIIEELGAVVSVERQGEVQALTISGGPVMEAIGTGCSVAVNGVCVTVVRTSDTGLMFEVIPETLRRTNLGDLDPGDAVNLERPLAANGRLDGHIVQGHVDGTATILEVKPDGKSLLFDLEASSRLTQYIVEKGFVALDGASLTVTYCEGSQFGVALIPYTISNVRMGLGSVGDRVNVEVDLLAKYVEKMMSRTAESMET